MVSVKEIGLKMNIDKFNEILEEMASAIAEATNQEEADEISAEFDIKIEIAEKKLEEAFEKQIQEENDQLEKEFQKNLPEKEVNVSDFMIDIILRNDVDVAARILKYEEIRKLSSNMGLDTLGTERELISKIKTKLTKIQ